MQCLVYSDHGRKIKCKDQNSHFLIYTLQIALASLFYIFLIIGFGINFHIPINQSGKAHLNYSAYTVIFVFLSFKYFLFYFIVSLGKPCFLLWLYFPISICKSFLLLNTVSIILATKQTFTTLLLKLTYAIEHLSLVLLSTVFLKTHLSCIFLIKPLVQKLVNNT